MIIKFSRTRENLRQLMSFSEEGIGNAFKFEVDRKRYRQLYFNVR